MSKFSPTSPSQPVADHGISRIFRILRHLQWNRATAIRCRVGLGERTRPRVRRLTPRPPRPRAPPRVGPAWPGTRDFGISPANCRYRFPNLHAVSFQPRIRTCWYPYFHRVFRDSFPNGYEISGVNPDSAVKQGRVAGRVADIGVDALTTRADPVGPLWGRAPVCRFWLALQASRRIQGDRVSLNRQTSALPSGSDLSNHKPLPP